MKDGQTENMKPLSFFYNINMENDRPFLWPKKKKVFVEDKKSTDFVIKSGAKHSYERILIKERDLRYDSFIFTNSRIMSRY